MSSPSSAGTVPVSVVIITHRSSAALDAALESVLAQDHRPLEIILFGNGGQAEPNAASPPSDVPLRRGGSDRNLGVAGGRNAAAKLASGAALLFLDDDAALFPGAIRAAVHALESTGAGAVAFRILDPATGSPALWYYPFEQEPWSARRFEAPSVIGCGALVRREAFERLGGFWSGYFREVEEIDLSWRLIDAGWPIVYEPEAVVEHPERVERHLRFSVASNLLLVWRLLPARLALRQTAVKLAVFGVRSVRYAEVGLFARGVLDALRSSGRLGRERARLRPVTVRYLRRVHAPQGLGKRLQWSLRPLAPPAPHGGQPTGPDAPAESPSSPPRW